MTIARQFTQKNRIALAALLLAPALLLSGCGRDADLAEKVAAADAAALRAEAAAKRAEHAAGQAARAQPAAAVEAEAEAAPNGDQPDQAKANEAPPPSPAPTTEG